MSLARRRLLLCVLICCSSLAGRGAMAQAVLPSLRDPAISPDGREIAFCVGRRHLDGSGGGRRGASYGDASGNGVAAAVFAGWDEAGICFSPDGGGEYL